MHGFTWNCSTAGKINAGVTQLVESQPSKLLVAGSSPVSRSGVPAGGFFDFQFSIFNRSCACVAQLVEHFLGKEEVTGSIPVASSAEKHTDITEP